MWLKEAHIVVVIPRESQNLMQWWQKHHELHHGFPWVKAWLGGSHLTF